MKHKFIVELKDVDGGVPVLTAALHRTYCTDAYIQRIVGKDYYVEFLRDARTLDWAIHSALLDIHCSGLKCSKVTVVYPSKFARALDKACNWLNSLKIKIFSPFS